MSLQRFDVIVIGAGAAGLLCAAIAGQRGLTVLLLDHATKLAEKIRISGGGRCNFTNRDAGPANFLSDNPAFCRSALARYTPRDFIALVDRYRHRVARKDRGQLFCDESSEQIIALLLAECDAGGVGAAAAVPGARRAPRRGAASSWTPTPVRSCSASRRRHRRPVDPEDRRDRLRLPGRAAVRPSRHRAARRPWCR